MLRFPARRHFANAFGASRVVKTGKIDKNFNTFHDKLTCKFHLFFNELCIARREDKRLAKLASGIKDESQLKFNVKLSRIKFYLISFAFCRLSVISSLILDGSVIAGNVLIRLTPYNNIQYKLFADFRGSKCSSEGL